MENISQYIPFLIPIAIIEIGLALSAVIHILKHRSFRFGNTALWLVIVIVFEIIGPILYFTFGKGDD
ncbi:PLD nuclease N-terminal domain-containing protein [Clostridium felsineum]|uniref:PLD nuclease N-terminal domain-containing protein n=1 Tax=Clostridium felsineum TaxID=36839 RepID=UPI00214D5605|nr:PLD nuclease N-terminal domain-containing protein [Clostridium felsineum]MCR3759681.1 PLD nuclease N-terminal domain-containing protein [Clostridium felsineum]